MLVRWGRGKWRGTPCHTREATAERSSCCEKLMGRRTPGRRCNSLICLGLSTGLPSMAAHNPDSFRQRNTGPPAAAAAHACAPAMMQDAPARYGPPAYAWAWARQGLPRPPRPPRPRQGQGPQARARAIAKVCVWMGVRVGVGTRVNVGVNVGVGVGVGVRGCKCGCIC